MDVKRTSRSRLPSQALGVPRRAELVVSLQRLSQLLRAVHLWSSRGGCRCDRPAGGRARRVGPSVRRLGV